MDAKKRGKITSVWAQSITAKRFHNKDWGRAAHPGLSYRPEISLFFTTCVWINSSSML